MGYDAYVRCNCYRDGKISSKPPFEEFVEEDEEGIWLNLDWETNKEKHDAFDHWKYSNPCEHEDMEVCSERLANISGMGAFRRILIELGVENYPILSKYLPKANGGNLPVKYAFAMQQELEKLRQETTNEILIELKELTTNTRVQSINSKYELPFVFLGKSKLRCSLSQAGFQVIRERNLLGLKLQSIIFKSQKFKQTKLADKRYLLTDYNTQKTFELSVNLHSGDNCIDDFLEFQVIEANASVADEYSYIIEPLLKLTKASQETGNPIIWC